MAALVGLAALAVLGALVELVGLAAEIAYPLCRVGAATGGNTIPSIAAGLPTRTGQPRTALAERPVEILSPNASRAPGNRLAGKVATWPVLAEELE